jgi:hypothetical protein
MNRNALFETACDVRSSSVVRQDCRITRSKSIDPAL